MSSADHIGQSSVAEGVLVYLGITPAAQISQNPAHYPEHQFLCTPPRGRDSHHILIALFDNSSGVRITDADVAVRVSPRGVVGPRKDLHQMPVAGETTYCNYFDLSTLDTYVIEVEIRRPGVLDVVNAKFDYERYRGP